MTDHQVRELEDKLLIPLKHTIMKKILLLILTVLFVAVTTSCEGPTGPMGPQGDPGDDGYGTSWFTQSYKIKKSAWKLVGNKGELNSFYYTSIPVSDLTQTIYQDGTVLAYIETESGVKNSLPYVSHRGGKDSLGEFLWTQTYDFDFSVGYITVYLTYSDFNTQVSPDAETIHLVMMW